MTGRKNGLMRTLAIMAGFTLLVVGCERTDQTESGGSTRAANTRTAVESPTAVGPTVQQDPAASESKAPETATAVQKPADPVARESDASHAKVIAYYFHRTMRCPTCLSIEKQAREAVETAYSEELKAGKLEWHAVNIEEEGYEHFESDFDLSSSSLVIVQMDRDQVAAWKNLERVWELVEDPLGFQEYVWSELVEYLPG